MTNQISQSANKSNFASEVGVNVAFGGVLSGGFGSLSSVRKHGGIKKAIQATKENNKVLKAYKETLNGDVFLKNLKTSYNYQEYTSLAKKQARIQRKIDKNSISLFDKFKNIFKKDKITLGTLKKEANVAFEKMEQLKSGKSISEVAIKHLDNAQSVTQAAKGLFKSELKDPFGMIFAFTETAGRFTSTAIPAFKNEGFIAGLKATFDAVAAGVATFVSDAGLSVVFRTLGATAGAVFGPCGSAVGSFIGNSIGGLLSCKLIQKTFPVKEQQEELIAQNEVAQQTQIEPQAQEAIVAQAPIESNSTLSQETKNSSNTYFQPSKYQGMTSAYKGPRNQNAHKLEYSA